MKKVLILIKNILIILFSFFILYLKNLIILLVLFFLLLFSNSIIISKKQLIKRLIPLVTIGCFIIIFQMLFNWSIPFSQRLMAGTISFLKISVISLLIFFWIAITSPAEIISSLFFLPNNLKLLLTMTFYFIPSIILETQQISVVQKSRGLKTFLFNPFPLIIPLLHRVMKRAETLSLTIASRGYEND